jgi:hypothetical protein
MTTYFWHNDSQLMCEVDGAVFTCHDEYHGYRSTSIITRVTNPEEQYSHTTRLGSAYNLCAASYRQAERQRLHDKPLKEVYHTLMNYVQAAAAEPGNYYNAKHNALYAAALLVSAYCGGSQLGHTSSYIQEKQRSALERIEWAIKYIEGETNVS